MKLRGTHKSGKFFHMKLKVIGADKRRKTGAA
jgi:hypothetical protein